MVSADLEANGDSNASKAEVLAFAAKCRKESTRPDASLSHFKARTFARHNYAPGSDEVRDFLARQADRAEDAAKVITEYENTNWVKRHFQTIMSDVGDDVGWEIVNPLAIAGACAFVAPGVAIWLLGGAMITAENTVKHTLVGVASVFR